MARGLLWELWTFLQDPWAGVEAWRQRRAAMVKPAKPTYDAYPDHTEEQPDMWLVLQARDAMGRILSERVDLRGYSINHLRVERRVWQRSIWQAIEDARTVLRVRLRRSVAEAAKRAEERAAERYERAVARELRERERKP